MSFARRTLPYIVIVASLTGMWVASSEVAFANGLYCQWNIECPSCDPNDPVWVCDPTECEITYYFCSTFVTGECDQACDNEYSDCMDECDAEGGNIQACTHACDQVYAACIGACIPWM